MHIEIPDAFFLVTAYFPEVSREITYEFDFRRSCCSIGRTKIKKKINNVQNEQGSQS